METKVQSEIKVIHPERFTEQFRVPMEKFEAAADRAIKRMEKSLERFFDKFPTTSHSATNQYDQTDRVGWASSMGTGMYWLSYELSGNESFLRTAENHCRKCAVAAETGTNLDDHDTGFKFTPSCVAHYKITGDQRSKQAALRAAEILLAHYSWKNHFIVRVGDGTVNYHYDFCRALVDSMMNIPLFFWAYEQTGKQVYLDAAVGHYHTTEQYLIREDGSSYHHYQFDPATGDPVRGLTFQGHADESCWSRGHAWLVYGYPVAHSYTRDPHTIDIAKKVTNYFLNHLPGDLVPYWDFDFGEGSLEPRDSAAGAIAVCGMLELCRQLPKDSEEYTFYYTAAARIFEAIIDKCEITSEKEDGLMAHVTGAKPLTSDIDTIATYGDYFYLEALMRFLHPDWRMYW